MSVLKNTPINHSTKLEGYKKENFKCFKIAFPRLGFSQRKINNTNKNEPRTASVLGSDFCWRWQRHLSFCLANFGDDLFSPSSRHPNGMLLDEPVECVLGELSPALAILARSGKKMTGIERAKFETIVACRTLTPHVVEDPCPSPANFDGRRSEIDEADEKPEILESRRFREIVEFDPSPVILRSSPIECYYFVHGQ